MQKNRHKQGYKQLLCLRILSMVTRQPTDKEVKELDRSSNNKKPESKSESKPDPESESKAPFIRLGDKTYNESEFTTMMMEFKQL